jgi:hypothetical protein
MLNRRNLIAAGVGLLGGLKSGMASSGFVPSDIIKAEASGNLPDPGEINIGSVGSVDFTPASLRGLGLSSEENELVSFFIEEATIDVSDRIGEMRAKYRSKRSWSEVYKESQHLKDMMAMRRIRHALHSKDDASKRIIAAVVKELGIR